MSEMTKREMINYILDYFDKHDWSDWAYRTGMPRYDYLDTREQEINCYLRNHSKIEIETWYYELLDEIRSIAELLYF